MGTSAKVRTNACFDSLLQLKDAGLIAADAACQVASADKILDVGTGRFEGKAIIDVSAIEIASNDEVYKISIQGSSSASFASDIVDLGILELGALEVIGGDVDSTTGRYILPFSNEKNGVYYRYIRGYVDVTGTIATGINFTAWVAPNQ
jgi:hypothetical protein